MRRRLIGVAGRPDDFSLWQARSMSHRCRKWGSASRRGSCQARRRRPNAGTSALSTWWPTAGLTRIMEKPLSVSIRRTRVGVAGKEATQTARRPLSIKARRIGGNACASHSSDGTCGTITRLVFSASSRRLHGTMHRIPSLQSPFAEVSALRPSSAELWPPGQE